MKQVVKFDEFLEHNRYIVLLVQYYALHRKEPIQKAQNLQTAKYRENCVLISKYSIFLMQ
jgi:hypothetical protein